MEVTVFVYKAIANLQLDDGSIIQAPYYYESHNETLDELVSSTTFFYDSGSIYFNSEGYIIINA